MNVILVYCEYGIWYFFFCFFLGCVVYSFVFLCGISYFDGLWGDVRGCW